GGPTSPTESEGLDQTRLWPSAGSVPRNTRCSGRSRTGGRGSNVIGIGSVLVGAAALEAGALDAAAGGGVVGQGVGAARFLQALQAQFGGRVGCAHGCFP